MTFIYYTAEIDRTTDPKHTRVTIQRNAEPTFNRFNTVLSIDDQVITIAWSSEPTPGEADRLHQKLRADHTRSDDDETEIIEASPL